LIPERAVLVAAARRDLHTPPQDGVVDLGNPHSPNLEGLAAARAAVVVGDRGIHGRLEPDLARGGARVVLLDTNGVDATLEGLAALGEQLGDGGALRRRGDAFRARLAELHLGKAVSVLPLFGTPDSFFVVTGRAWLGDLLEKLGFELPAAGDAGGERFPGLVPVSDELLVTLRPDLVVLVAHGDPRTLREALVQKTAPGGPWSSVGRSASLGVQVLPPELFASNPGLGMERAAEALVALAAPAAGRAP
jgi:iron complex transport system substrate-binding protein